MILQFRPGTGPTKTCLHLISSSTDFMNIDNLTEVMYTFGFLPYMAISSLYNNPVISPAQITFISVPHATMVLHK